MKPRIVRVYERSNSGFVRRLKSVDLFSGAGGLAEGFRQSGFSVLSANDVNPSAGETFRRNFPGASFFQCPISDLTGVELLEDASLKAGDLDCLIGGPPCQSFSYNNHNRSRRKARSRLFRDYLRIVEALQPKCLVMENVPGILTVGGGAIVCEIQDALDELGYECQARTLYAEDYGVPQQRRRVFFLATRLGWDDRLFPRGRFGPIQKPSLEASPYVHRWKPHGNQHRRRVPTVWSAIGDLPAIGNGETFVGAYERAAGTLYQRLMRGNTNVVLNHFAPKLEPANLERLRHVPEGGNWRDIPFDLLPKGMQRARPSDHTKRYGRLSKRGLCCTVLTKCDPHWGSYIHPTQDRALSARELARLQSFPDRFEFMGLRSQQFEQIGNAVPPLMAAAVGTAVRAHIERNAGQANKGAA